MLAPFAFQWVAKSVCSQYFITLFVVIVTAGFYWWKRPRGFPQGPRGIPFLGVIPSMGKYPERTIKKWSLEKYGTIMCARMGSADCVFLNTAEVIKKAFTGLGNHVSGRPAHTIFKQVTEEKGIALKQYGEDYKIMRNFIMRAVYSHEPGTQSLEERIKEEASLFADYLKNNTSKPIDFKLYLYVLTSNIISRVVLGRRFDYDDSEYRELLLNLQKVLGESSDAPLNLLIDLHPSLKYLPWFRHANNTMVTRMKGALDFAKKIIEDHEEIFDKNFLQDLIDKFIFEQQNGSDKIKTLFTKEELVVIIRDLVSAGSETTSNTISWLLIALMHNQDHLRKVVREIDQVMGTKEPNSRHKVKMPFTCAVIQETMRYRTVTPYGIQHCVTSPVELDGYIIPKGTLVYSNIWGAHNDPVVWPNPSKFDPYRHIDNAGNFIYSSNVIPFSVGNRNCIGEQLAKQEIFIFVTKILQKFELTVPPGKPLPSLEGVNCLQFIPLSCELMLTER